VGTSVWRVLLGWTPTVCPRTCAGRSRIGPRTLSGGEVGRFCQRQGISRSVFYKIRRQALELGPVGATEPGSRRPRNSPARTDPEVIGHALPVRVWLPGPHPALAGHTRPGVRRGRGLQARAAQAAQVGRPGVRLPCTELLLAERCFRLVPGRRNRGRDPPGHRRPLAPGAGDPGGRGRDVSSVHAGRLGTCQAG
jgi:hypothetical protein